MENFSDLIQRLEANAKTSLAGKNRPATKPAGDQAPAPASPGPEPDQARDREPEASDPNRPAPAVALPADPDPDPDRPPPGPVKDRLEGPTGPPPAVAIEGKPPGQGPGGLRKRKSRGVAGIVGKRHSGVACPSCGQGSSRVYCTRGASRFRHCQTCGQKFSTVERVQIKKSTTNSTFKEI